MLLQPLLMLPLLLLLLIGRILFSKSVSLLCCFCGLFVAVVVVVVVVIVVVLMVIMMPALLMKVIALAERLRVENAKMKPMEEMLQQVSRDM